MVVKTSQRSGIFSPRIRREPKKCGKSIHRPSDLVFLEVLLGFLASMRSGCSSGFSWDFSRGFGQFQHHQLRPYFHTAVLPWRRWISNEILYMSRGVHILVRHGRKKFLSPGYLFRTETFFWPSPTFANPHCSRFGAFFTTSF